MKAYELYTNMSDELVASQFQWMRDEERELYKTAIATLADQKKLRPTFVTKKSIPEQFAWIRKQLSGKRTEMVGEHLLQTWLMNGQQDLLVTFCDAMGIKHDGNGSVEEALPESLDDEKLAAAADALFEKFPSGLASLYLYIFNLQADSGWDNLTKILAEDSRVNLD